ncbi:hypothetical protein SLS64_005252 [Diaporthe eres]|uniref:Uncharacterized protein n=1 Tax=Diaporthe eres TaxID=83184 RepID=A0ABR1NX45_DIAER
MENWNQNSHFTTEPIVYFKFCFEFKENYATPESDAVEHSVAVEKSGVVEIYTSGATQEADGTGEDDADEKNGAVKEIIIISDEESDAAKRDGAVEEIITISDEESDATEENTSIREDPFVGRYRIEDTSFERLLCGMFALGISTFSQLGTQLTQSEFWRAYDSQEMQDFNKGSGYTNRDNFYDDQLAAVLRIWGRHHGRDNLQLGLITEGSENVFVIGDEKFEVVSSVEDMEKQRDFTTVWIHNDNMQQLRAALMNHYSGITLLGRSEEPNDISEEGSSTKEDNDTEMGDDEETGQETGEENLGKILRAPEEGKFTEDLKREVSWIHVEKFDSKWEDSQNMDRQIVLFQIR